MLCEFGMRKIVVGVIGGTVLLLGIVMIVLPGPAFLIIPAGLAILGTEFIWARRALRRAKGMASKARRKSPLLTKLFPRKKPKRSAPNTTAPGSSQNPQSPVRPQDCP